MRSLFSPLKLVAAVSALCVAVPAMSFEAGDIVLRVGAATVDPREDSDNIALDGTTVTIGGAPTTIGLDSDTQLGLTLEYFLTPNLGVEVLAATPFKHTAVLNGGLAGVGDIADFTHLPPTVSAVYHLNDMGGFQPYVGVGLNYTFIYEENLDNSAAGALAGLGLTGGDIELEDSFGIALQAGVDWLLDEKWLVNASVRWIDISTEAEISFDGGSKIKADVDVDPFVYTLSVGYKF